MPRKLISYVGKRVLAKDFKNLLMVANKMGLDGGRITDISIKACPNQKHAVIVGHEPVKDVRFYPECPECSHSMECPACGHPNFDKGEGR